MAKVLFEDFLGHELIVNTQAGLKRYELSVSDSKKIVIKDSFFSAFGDDYLKKEALPQKAKLTNFEFKDESFDLAIIYGEDKLIVKADLIEIGFDIVGSAFFMLSRMEELLETKRDEHDRFPTKKSISRQCNFHQVPIVDVYVRFLQRCFEHLISPNEIKQFQSSISPSHDLDHLNKLHNLRSLGGAVKRALKKSGSIMHSSHYVARFLNKSNPYDQIKRLVNLAGKRNTVAMFYFLVGGNSSYDSGHFDNQRKEAEKFRIMIEGEGHEIGLHPSYLTMKDPVLLQKEKEKIEDWLGREIVFSRQHYLRVKLPDTWLNLEQVGIQFDASLAYPELPGFRCGTSRDYPVFDLRNRKVLNLREKPLIAMDTSVLKDESLNLDEKYREIERIKEQIKLNGGNWHFLIHNSNFFWLDEKDYFELWHSIYEF